MNRLTKVDEGSWLEGCLEGMGAYFNIDPIILRIAFIMLSCYNVGVALLIYAILAIVMPGDGE